MYKPAEVAHDFHVKYIQMNIDIHAMRKMVPFAQPSIEICYVFLVKHHETTWSDQLRSLRTGGEPNPDRGRTPTATTRPTGRASLWPPRSDEAKSETFQTEAAVRDLQGDPYSFLRDVDVFSG